MKTTLTYLKSIAFLLFGCFLLWVALKDINISELSQTIKKIPLKWVLISMLLGYLAFVFRGLRWLLLIKPLGYHPKTWTISVFFHVERSP